MDASEVNFDGLWLFTDGSCTKFPMASRLNRAGWAAVMVDEDGNVINAAYGPVPWEANP